MNSKSQFDPNFKSTNVDKSHSVVPFRAKKKKANLTKREQRLVSMLHNKEQLDRRLMYIDVGLGLSSSVTVGTNSPTVFGNLVSLTIIAQGAGQASRTSDSVWLKNLHINGSFYYNFSASGFTQDYVQTVRRTIFQWCPNSALVAVTPASLFQNVSTTTVYSLFDFELKNNYRVISDEFFTVSGFADSATGFALPNGDSIVVFNEDFNLRNSRVDFSPGATTASNHLYIALTCNSTSGPAPLVELACRTYYYNDNA